MPAVAELFTKIGPITLGRRTFDISDDQPYWLNDQGQISQESGAVVYINQIDSGTLTITHFKRINPIASVIRGEFGRSTDDFANLDPGGSHTLLLGIFRRLKVTNTRPIETIKE